MIECARKTDQNKFHVEISKIVINICLIVMDCKGMIVFQNWPPPQHLHMSMLRSDTMPNDLMGGPVLAYNPLKF